MKPYSKKYFRNYEAVEVPDGKGGSKKELRYYGDLYCQDLTEEARRLQKRLFLTAALLCDAAWVLAVTRNIEGNRGGLLSAMGLGLIFPLFFMTVGCARGCRMKKDMTRNDYRGSSLFIRFGSSAGALLALATAVWQGVFIFDGGVPSETSAGYAAIAGYAFTAAACAVVCFFEMRTKYIITKGRNGAVEPDRHQYE